MNRRGSEFQLIHQLTAGRNTGRADVFLGVGDDAAVVEEDGRFLLFTCDAQVESVHFLSDVPAHLLGARLAAVNLSDIAAMGGNPLWALCSLFPALNSSASFLTEMYDGMHDVFNGYGVQLIGGNVARSNGGLIADLFLAGEVPKNEVLLRSGAQPGDVLCVTGTLGDSAAGLSILLSREKALSEEQKQLTARHLQPRPRVAEGRILAASGKVHACMDISDGLLQDCSHMAEASNVSICIDDATLPISDTMRSVARMSELDETLSALTGGEDYELLFTVSPEAVHEIQQRLQEETGTEITPIGTVQVADTADHGVSVRTAEYNYLLRGGFDHLQNVAPHKIEKSEQ